MAALRELGTRGVAALALLAGCGGAGPRVPQERRCDNGEAIAKIAALSRDGRLDRAASSAEEEWARCPTTASANALASALERLGRADELDRLASRTSEPSSRSAFVTAAANARQVKADADDLLTRAAAAAREGNVVEARRLRDLAMHRLEMKHDARARLEPNDGADIHFRSGAVGRWLLVDQRVLVETATGRETFLPGKAFSLSDDERWLGLDLEGAIAIRDLSSGKNLVEVRGRSPFVTFTPTRAALVATREEEQVVVFVDLATASTWEVPAGGDTKGKVTLDAAGRHAAWQAGTTLHVANLEARTSTTFQVPAGLQTISFDGAYVDVTSDGFMLVVRLDEMREVVRGGGGFASRHEDTLVTDEGNLTLAVSDLRTGKTRKIALPKPKCADAWNLRRESEGKQVVGTTCTYVDSDATDRLTVDVATGRVTFKPLVAPTEAQREANRRRDAEHASAYAAQRDAIVARCQKAGGLRCAELFGEHGSDTLVPGGRLLMTRDGVVLTDAEDFTKVKVKLAESRDLDLSILSGGLRALPSGVLLATDTTRRARLWDLATGAVRWRGPIAPEEVKLAALASDGGLVTASENGVVRRYSMATGRLERTRRIPGCTAIALAAAEEPVVACREGSRIAVHVGFERGPVHTFEDVVAFGLDVEGRHVVTAKRDGRELVLTPLLTNAPPRALKIDYAPLGTMHVAGDWAATTAAALFDLRTGTKRSSPSRDHVYGLAIDRDRTWAAFSRSDEVEAVGLEDASRKVLFTGAGRLDHLALGPSGVFGTDGRNLVLWSWDAPSSPRKVELGRPLLALTANGNAVFGGRGAVVASLPDMRPLRSFAAVAEKDAAISLSGEEASITGDAKDAYGVVHCMIGPRRLPFEICEGRFVRP